MAINSETRHQPTRPARAVGVGGVHNYVDADIELDEQLDDRACEWEAWALEEVDTLILRFDRRAQLIWANPAVERTTGWRSSELTGQDFTALRAMLGLEVERSTIVRGLLRTGEWSDCLCLQTRAGQPRLVHVRVTALRGPDGALDGATAIVRDETELHRLRSVAEAVNLAANVGQMFAGIRHELGNPIHALKTALMALRKRWARFDATRVDHYFAHMLAEVDRVEHLLASLRTFSAFEEVELRACSTQRMLRDLEPLVTAAARERGVTVQIDSSSDLWVKADWRALYQALMNLVTNAMDAVVKTHGRVTLFATRADADAVVLEVADNGEGIPAEELEAAFRPFFTTKPHGNGLGLPIVQRLAVAMGGELVLESEPGRGTRARLVLVEAAPESDQT